MKLIIDVPDNVYAKVLEYYEHNGIVEAVYGYIYRGIPLEQIRAEIEEYKSTIDNAISEDELKIEGMQEAYNDCLEVIDKYTK